MRNLTTLKIKKLHENAVMPFFATYGAAGVDLTALTLEIDSEGCRYTYGTGLAFEIPEGYVGLIFPRSSIYKTGMTLTNCVGVIDSDYRGEVKFVFEHLYNRPTYQTGDRIGQLVLMQVPTVRIVEATELSETARGTGGFGSTGK